MPQPSRAVLLIGSPRGSHSTSYSLGMYLCERLKNNGMTFQTQYLYRPDHANENQTSILRLIDESDVLIVSFPLYVDSLPAPVIKTFELIANHVKNSTYNGKKYFMAIVNSGFPEASQNDIALSICRLFAKQVDFIWLGGLAKGGGEMIAGRPLNDFGGSVRYQKKALDLAADSIANGELITQEAATFMGTLGYPRWLYTFVSNRGWKQQAKKYIPVKKLYHQPYKKNQN